MTICLPCCHACFFLIYLFIVLGYLQDISIKNISVSSIKSWLSLSVPIFYLSIFLFFTILCFYLWIHFLDIYIYFLERHQKFICKIYLPKLNIIYLQYFIFGLVNCLFIFIPIYIFILSLIYITNICYNYFFFIHILIKFRFFCFSILIRNTIKINARLFNIY